MARLRSEGMGGMRFERFPVLCLRGRALTLLLAAACVAFSLVGCSSVSSGASGASVTAAESLAAQEAAEAFDYGIDVTIVVADVTEAATYYNYDADGTTVQLFAVRASDGTVRLALNTCQVCTGSTKAYFVQSGDAFVCQNCGNSFAADEVGEEAYGCNPIPITSADYAEADGVIIVSADFLEGYASSFARWKG